MARGRLPPACLLLCIEDWPLLPVSGLCLSDGTVRPGRTTASSHGQLTFSCTSLSRYWNYALAYYLCLLSIIHYSYLLFIHYTFIFIIHIYCNYSLLKFTRLEIHLFFNWFIVHTVFWPVWICQFNQSINQSVTFININIAGGLIRRWWILVLSRCHASMVRISQTACLPSYLANPGPRPSGPLEPCPSLGPACGRCSCAPLLY